ncbi:hypothetical protein [Pseudomonas aeruginosa]|uniref:hypothetical protein n=1 Tax=Pseudomonas aeruginosa TaxID=287 RepID=UPI0021E71FCB|nr:hypothetical protein [Pseudomonas aeruginosa]MCV3836365.1 hypothetical protein [Pseudomonas aeruginosa]MDP5728910.1 hypothetical protein [Pseudomonas aeruginosa]HCI2338798.1 hypothetical protein [Pseudomonas aeruginosa]
MKNSDSSKSSISERSSSRERGTDNKVVSLSFFKERKQEEEYRTAMKKVLAKAKELDW